MRQIRAWSARLIATIIGRRSERELTEELESHLQLHVDDNLRAGMSPAEARRRAIVALGGIEQTKERVREQGGIPPVEQVLQDIRYAARGLRRDAGFTATALLTVTLGIGATTAIFSVVDAVVLRALPFDEHDRLVAVGQLVTPGPYRDPRADPLRLATIAPQNYLDWTARQQVFEAMAAWTVQDLTLHLPDAPPADVRAARTTAGLFDVLRVRPMLGRSFSAAHEEDGHNHVAVVSEAFWRRYLDGDPSSVGQTIRLNSDSYEVLAVMPEGFTFPPGLPRPVEVWVPYVVPPGERERHPHRINTYLQSVARLAPGVSIEQAQAQMDHIAAALEQDHPVWNKGSRIGVRSLHDHIVGARVTSWMLMLLGAVVVVLLIACANVANLLLARATAREREIALRAALGASRSRIARQLLTETLMLAFAGMLLGVLVASWGVDVLRTSMPTNVPRVAEIGIDVRVLIVAAGLSVATGLLFGSLPAFRASNPRLATALKNGGVGTAGGAGHRLRSVLVVAEISLAVMLLVGAALFISSFINVARISPGFDATRVLTATVSATADASTPSADDTPRLLQLVNDIGELPGVVHASIIAGGLPLSSSMSRTTMTVPGKPFDLGESERRVSIRPVTPEYHDALGIPLKKGRLFAPTDRQGTAPVVIINEAAARPFFPGEDPINRSVTLNNEDRTIVGIAGDIRQLGLELGPVEEAYVPLAQGQVLRGGNFVLVVRTSGDPYELVSAMTPVVLKAFPDVPLRHVRSMEDLLRAQTAHRRISMLLFSLFGLLGLCIAAIGVYGVMAYAVAQRRREFGIRMALGATRGRVLRMVLANALALVTAGCVIGVAGAWYLSEAAGAFLFNVESTDLRAFGAALVVLTAAAILSSVIPARRATRVDPMIALRAE